MDLYQGQTTSEGDHDSGAWQENLPPDQHNLELKLERKREGKISICNDKWILQEKKKQRSSQLSLCGLRFGLGVFIFSSGPLSIHLPLCLETCLYVSAGSQAALASIRFSQQESASRRLEGGRRIKLAPSQLRHHAGAASLF